MHQPPLVGFDASEDGMIRFALDALNQAGYDTGVFQELIKVDMPKGFRAMSLDGGAALGKEAFESQEWLIHVMEEELLHLIQKAAGLTQEFARGTALVFLNRETHGD
ncbi:MAG: hypothetical protein HYX68_08200 [Planctomycetes bacterium]|nr:hypothetical protein [Planctomycetota bacterium]